MIFWDVNKPNKYNFLKKLIFPYSAPFTKKRFGNCKDGGYVFLKELFDESSIVYSYGIDDALDSISFDLDCASEGKSVYMYDGTINKCPVENPKLFFKKENLYQGILERHLSENGHEEKTNMVLKMDIEGSEYEVVNSDIEFIHNHFNQISMEVHGLIEELNPHSVVSPETALIKKDERIKKNFFTNIGKYYNIVHIHANNHGDRYADFPDTLEITFLRKDYEVNQVDYSQYPIDKIDYPNCNGLDDFILNWWV